MQQDLSIARATHRPGSARPCDDSYSDVRVAAVYAALYGPGPDTDHYRSLAGPVPLDVLDVGCGSGRLGVLLAQDGHRVVGIDLSAAMLAEACRRDRTGSASWNVGDARTLHLERTFDLVVMTGHAFQVLFDDREMAAFLTGAYAHLRPGGTLAFETRNPAARAWTDWTPARSRRMVEVERLGSVEVHNDVVGVGGEHVTHRTSYRFDDGSELHTSATLRFPSEAGVVAALRTAGFATIDVRGGWDGSAVTTASRELVVVAARPAEPVLK